MLAKQLTIFVENRKGRLGEVLRVLKENEINILSLSLADTTEYGLLRLIVNNPEKGKATLSEAGFATMLTDIVVIEIPHTAGSLQSLLDIFSENDINIEYMYGLSTSETHAFVVLKASDMDKANVVLDKNGVKTLSTKDIVEL